MIVPLEPKRTLPVLEEPPIRAEEFWGAKWDAESFSDCSARRFQDYSPRSLLSLGSLPFALESSELTDGRRLAIPNFGRRRGPAEYIGKEILMSEESSGAPRAEEGSSAEVRAALKAIRDDVARLSDDIAQLARDRADNAGAAITGAVVSAKSQAAQAKSDIEDCLRGAETRLRSQIQESPLTLAVVLIAVGYALGRRRNVRRR